MNAAAGLLLMGLGLGGAKNPGLFVLWGGVAFLLSAPAVLTEIQQGRFGWKHRGFWGLFACVGVSLLFSLNRSVSLYFTTQALIFLLLWIALRSGRLGSSNNPSFRWTLEAAGLLTASVTLWQMLSRRLPYGLIPTNPNFNAVWMASLSVVFLAWTLGESNASRTERQASGALAFSLAGLVIFGPSRSALLALSLGLLYALFPLKRSRREVWIGLFAVLLVPLCVPSVFLTRLQLLADSSTQNYRLRIWKTAVHAALDRPLTGYGLGNFEIAYQRHAFPVNEETVRFARTTEFAHNEVLQTAAELGIPAAGILLFSIFFILRRIAKADGPKNTAAKAALGVFLMASFFNPIWHVPFLLYVTLFWAAELLPPETLKKTPHPHPLPLERGEGVRERGWTLLQQSGMVLLMGSTALLLGWFGLRTVWSTHHEWNRIVRWNPGDAAAWQARALEQTELDEKIQSMAEAVRHSPHDVYYREQLAELLERSRRPENFEQALAQYHAAFDLAPTRAINALAAGRLLYVKRDVPAALEEFKTARRLEPYFWESDFWMARSLHALGEKRAAIRLLRELAKRRDRFLTEQASLRHPPPSGYAQRILSYNAAVVQNELRRFQS